MPALRWQGESRRKATEGWHGEGSPWVSPWVSDLGSKDPLVVKSLVAVLTA